MARKRKKTGPRRLVLDGNDKEMILSKISTVNLSTSNDEFIYFDKLKNGTWRICSTAGTIPDIETLKGILIESLESK